MIVVQSKERMTGVSMRIINLIEDTQGEKELHHEHGLSFYIETQKHKILLDTGLSDAFLENAVRLGIDLTQVDMVVLSHGHYDHAGGILAFAKMNPNATIYMQKTAGGDYYNLRDDSEKYIGIDKRILELPQVCFLNGDYRIDEEIYVFTDILGRKYWPQSNMLLKEKVEERFIQDAFAHEQCLVISENHENVLLSGCAHNGILNILEAYTERFEGAPDKVISGFHMMKRGEYTAEEVEVIEDTARELKKLHTKFYTGHCTGEAAFDIMKVIMGKQLIFVHSGDEI